MSPRLGVIVMLIGVRQLGIRLMFKFMTEGRLLGIAGVGPSMLVGLAATAIINGLGLMFVAALSALVPASRVSRIGIVDALRHV